MNAPDRKAVLAAGAAAEGGYPAGPLAVIAAALLAVFLLAFLVVPVCLSIGAGFFHEGRISLYWFGRVLTNEILMGKLSRAGVLLRFAVQLFLLFGVPYVALRLRRRTAGARLGTALLAAAICSPAAGAAWMALLWLLRGVPPLEFGQLGNGLALACVTTFVSLVVAVPLAIIRTRCRFLGSGVLGALLLLPLILPPFVGALSMRRMLAQYGTVNLFLERAGLLGVLGLGYTDWLGSGFVAVVILQVLHLFPILYLNASASLANVDPTYAQAARNLGAGPLRTFFKITLPLMRPGLFAGGTIVFIWSFTDIGTPLIVGYDELIPITVFRELSQAEVNPRTFSLVLIMLATSVALYVVGKFVFGRGAAAETSKASVAAEPRRLGFVGTAGAWLLFGAVIFLALLPHIGVVLTALSDRWVNTVVPSRYTLNHLLFVVTRPATYNSILNSLMYASVSTGVDVVLGCAAAWLLVRYRLPGRTFLDALVMLPLAVPGLILAAGYVAMTARGSPLEGIGPMGNPFLILVIAYSVRRLPFVVRGVSAGLQQVPVSLEEAGWNLGASRGRTAFRITLPLIAASILAASVLTFAFAMLEVSDSLILAQEQAHYPITKEIYRQAASGNLDAANIASALGVYGMLLLGGTFAVAGALMGRRLGAIFRA